VIVDNIPMLETPLFSIYFLITFYLFPDFL